jgi:hypothetical protein
MVGRHWGSSLLYSSSRLVECLADLRKVGRLGDDLEHLFFFLDLVGARVQNGHQDVVLREAVRLGDLDHALALEQERNRPGVGHGSAIARDRNPNVRCGTVLVVREALDVQGRALGSAGFVEDLGVLDDLAGQAGTALDRAVDVVIGHRVLLGLGNGQVQRGDCRRHRHRPCGRPPQCP